MYVFFSMRWPRCYCWASQHTVVTGASNHLVSGEFTNTSSFISIFVARSQSGFSPVPENNQSVTQLFQGGQVRRKPRSMAQRWMASWGQGQYVGLANRGGVGRK